MAKIKIERLPTDVSDKVTASTAAIAATGILIWILEATIGIDIPSAIEVLAGTIAVFGAGYIKTDKVEIGAEV